MSQSFGILADRPECYVYSSALGCVITALPREDVAVHYSARDALLAVERDPDRVEGLDVGRDLRAIVTRILDNGVGERFGLTGSFLLGCATERSDIDLVSYGAEGYAAAAELFADRRLVRPYGGHELGRLYRRRARYLAGVAFDPLVRQELRKLQGLTVGADAHVNCEPLRADDDHRLAAVAAKEIGEVSVLATVVDHEQGLMTPAMYRIEVQRIVRSTVSEPEAFARRIGYLRSYLGAYTGAFRAGDDVFVCGKLVHLRDDGDDGADGFGIELTPWAANTSYLANLAR